MDLAREKEATELSDALKRQINYTSHYQGNLQQSQIVNGIAIAFFILLFVKGREKEHEPN